MDVSTDLHELTAEERRNTAARTALRYLAWLSTDSDTRTIDRAAAWLLGATRYVERWQAEDDGTEDWASHLAAAKVARHNGWSVRTAERRLAAYQAVTHTAPW